MAKYYRDEHGVWWMKRKNQRCRCVLLTCPTCGVEFPRSKSDLGRSDVQVCSKKCVRGQLAWQWKGGFCVNTEGYVVLHRPGHPSARANGSILEHRLVMEEHLGRQLLKHEMVHHKNGDRADNRIENLELCSKWQPPGQRVQDKVAYAKEVLAAYDPDSLMPAF